MSLAGAMLFAVSHSKKKKLEKAKAQLNCDDDKETLSDEETLSDNDYVHEIMPNNGTPNYGTPKYATPQPSRLSSSVSANPVNSIKREAVGTTFLNESTIEERVLIGRVNGREVTIPLSKVPITLGKQAGVSDIIVDDNAVSKMHARFEEMDGKVYIYDLNSTNGTVKNGAMLDINHPVVLEPGDRLRFGRSSFTYC
jgi:pSer/pThr/pTyr-binding forkhead associated (FHA) protein